MPNRQEFLLISSIETKTLEGILDASLLFFNKKHEKLRKAHLWSNVSNSTVISIVNDPLALKQPLIHGTSFGETGMETWLQIASELSSCFVCSSC